MSDFPKSVEFHEEGVREGFQMEPLTYPRERRIALLDALSATGLRQIQVGSLVNPRKVPQMADTLELFAELERRPGVRYTLLWLNESGYRKARAVEGAFNHAPLMYYLTDAFALRTGYIYDFEGKIFNPTFGAGIRLLQYGFDFGYTAGPQQHPRANTMFFSVNIKL